MKAILQFGGLNFVTAGHSYRELCEDVRRSLSSLAPLRRGDLCFLCHFPPNSNGEEEGLFPVYSEESYLRFREKALTNGNTRSTDVLPVLQLDAQGTPGAYRLLAAKGRGYSPVPAHPGNERPASSSMVAGVSASPDSPYREVSDCVHKGLSQDTVEGIALSEDAKRGLEVKSYAEYLKLLQELDRQTPYHSPDVASPLVSSLHPPAPAPATIPPLPLHSSQNHIPFVSSSLPSGSAKSTPRRPHSAISDWRPTPKKLHGDEPLLSSRESELLSHLLSQTDDMRCSDSHIVSRHTTPRGPAGTRTQSSAGSGARGTPRPASTPHLQTVNVVTKTCVPMSTLPPRPAQQRPISSIPGQQDDMRSRSRSASEDYHQLFSRPPVSSMYEKLLSQPAEVSEVPPPPSLARNGLTEKRAKA